MTDPNSRSQDVYGPGTYTDHTFTPVPSDTARIFRLITSQTPGFTDNPELLSKVSFEGEELPVIPGPIKAVSVAAALHGMVGVLLDEILRLRGEEKPDRRITINTTHTAIWFATVLTAFVGGDDIATLGARNKLRDLVPDWERGWTNTPMKLRGTAIYPTKKPATWYCVHGSMDMPSMLRSLGIDPERPGIDTNEKAAEYIASVTREMSPYDLEMTNIMNGNCGSICFTPKEWAESGMGKALAARPLVDVTEQPSHATTPPPKVPFAPFNSTDKRPLIGIKVVELTRVIAGPQIGTYLASLGADVIRINAPHLPDLNMMQVTLTAGKRTIALDLRESGDHAYLHRLLEQADVFLQGFRLGKMNKFGLSVEQLTAMAARRGRGIIYVSENCYGRDGVYAERPGWQQIADSASGAAYVMGRGQKLPDGEAVLPSLPISDMTGGVLGVVGTLMALRDRATKGGSYSVHAALTAVNVFALKPEVGLYPLEVVAECQARFQWGEMRGAHHVVDHLRTVWTGWKRVIPQYLAEDSGLFTSFENSAFQGMKLSILRPVVRLSDEQSTPRWLTGSVPYAHWKKEDVDFDGSK